MTLHHQILVIIDGPSEEDRAWLQRALEAISRQHNIPEILSHLEIEDLAVFKESHCLKKQSHRFGYVLAVGSQAENKVKDQVQKEGFCWKTIPPVNSWPDKEIRTNAARGIEEIFQEWKNQTFEKKVILLGKEKIDTSPNWIRANLADVQRYFQLQITANRFPVVLFKPDVIQDSQKPSLAIRDVTRRLRQPETDLVAVIVSQEIFKDPEQLKKATQVAKDSGYQEVFMTTTEDFIKSLEIICALAENGVAPVEILASEKEVA